MRGSLERVRSELAERLRTRRGEIEEALLTRTYAIADPAEAADPEYAQGLRAAVSAALDYGVAAVEHGEERAPPVPVMLLAQARLAARNGVNLDTVLRRYFAGYTTLGDFIVQEAGRAKLGEAGLKLLLRDQAALFDRFLVTVADEHSREADGRLFTQEERRTKRIEMLLAGELLDTSAFAYDFGSWHVGAIAAGPEADAILRAFASKLGRNLLLLCSGEQTYWGWFGSRHQGDPGELHDAVTSVSADRSPLAIGEPGQGIAGWRLTHHQASAALPIAMAEGTCTQYVDVALLASALSDKLLATSLRQLFLLPLEQERDGGQSVRETLRVYFRSGRNVSSAAASLGVSRQTVAARLRTAEERLDLPLDRYASELDIALRVESGAAYT